MNPGQARALCAAATRELLWGLRAVTRELACWRQRAQTIPTAAIRLDALNVLEHKRTHLHGAALFWTLPRQRNDVLLRLLVAYELIWDFLDNLSERATAHGCNDGRALHAAIAEAIDVSTTTSDYYRDHPWHDDGGYLTTLVHACQKACLALPSYAVVRDLAVAEAHRAQVLALNHLRDPAARDHALKRWAAQEHPGKQGLRWWELSGAASAPLAIHALLALAAEPACSRSDACRAHAAYAPWVSAATTMLDSYVDQLQDLASDDHSYVSHYPEADAAITGIEALVSQSLAQVGALRDGQRHAVIVASMIAMYLSKDDARSDQLREGTESFIRAGGSLVRLLLPILRTWRRMYGQRAA